MRLQVTDKNGIEYGGRRYREGEEFDVEDTSRGKAWAGAFLAKKRARRFEPTLVGSTTPPPKPAPPPPAVEPSAPPPVFQPDEDEQTAVEQKDLLPEQDASAEASNPSRRGRYSRRDIRPEE